MIFQPAYFFVDDQQNADSALTEIAIKDTSRKIWIQFVTKFHQWFDNNPIKGLEMMAGNERSLRRQSILAFSYQFSLWALTSKEAMSANERRRKIVHSNRYKVSRSFCQTVVHGARPIHPGR